jgi:hypothetical protein
VTQGKCADSRGHGFGRLPAVFAVVVGLVRAVIIALVFIR